MPKDYVYFDLETQRSANDVGGWNNKGAMGMSVGVTYSTATGEYRVYREDKVDRLVKQLINADLVIGYNHVNFDYAVLEGYQPLYLAEQCNNLDLMVDLEVSSGVRPNLESVASASIGAGKTAKGIDAIKWWREGRYRDVAEYCCYDVKVTMLVHRFGAEHGHVKFTDRFGMNREVDVQWCLP